MTAAADSRAHDDDKKLMASPATACNEDNNLVDRCDDEGNGSGVNDDDDVYDGARRQRGARGITWRRQGSHHP